MEQIGIYLDALVQLIYPKLCLACENKTQVKEHVFCMSCLSKLVFTNQHSEQKNSFVEHFIGRIDLDHASALFYFYKSNPIQELVHKLKYEKRPIIGKKLGQLHGELLLKSSFYKEIDLILPVPLHPKRQWQRGYNQSDLYAIGIANSLKKPVYSKSI
ncbi:MAG: ComF family protein, partial [Bacteroidota bacterium]